MRLGGAAVTQHATTRPAAAWSGLTAFRAMVAKAACSFARRQLGGGSGLRIEEKLSLGPKKTLFLVNCRGKQFLVAAGADSVTQMVEVFSQRRERAASFSNSRMGVGTAAQHKREKRP